MVYSCEPTRLLLDKSWKVICSAIQASLFNKPIDVSSNINWAEVFRESKKQTIIAIVRNGLKERLPKEIEAKWKQYDITNVYHFVKVIDEQKKLCDLLAQSAIPFVILKGTAAAIYYPVPNLRDMGDVDFLVPLPYFEKARQTLLANQFDQKEDDDSRHTKFSKNDILFEMHRRFSYEGDLVDVDSYINNCMDHLDSGTIRNRSFPMLPPLENGLVLLAHLRQHLMEGVGLRQILDWMMYVHAVLNDEFWKAEFEPELEKLHLRTLAITVTRMCQIYLGLSEDIRWCAEAEQSLCARLMDNIINSGNFGINHESGTEIEKTIVNLKREGGLRYLQKAGEFNWKAYRSHHWLKPFAWIYQIFRYLRQGINTQRSTPEVADDFKRGKERHKLLKDLDCI